jgi:hypothetical protein
MNDSRRLHLVVATVALVALVGLVAGGTGSAGATSKAIATVIKIKGNKLPKFVGPKTVTAGTSLEILNKTKVEKIGPHTFSLLTKSERPKGEKERKKCARLKGTCGDIGDAHDLNPDTYESGTHVVENGLVGWDTPFDGDSPGDSFYTDTKGEQHTRSVTAAPGTKLYFMCIVHPHTQGKIKVTAP